ncbi:S49 family peptidase [Allochromatium humboldtianum]|uniref:S49 family peptidase n=1 Tax=Allochromatium humboldtianum TaxID=504901 RepID=A0A850RCF3_9GAMM|nr:S49 family peptidase [Allochromatium humboldtianum]NVZ11734.1 S49 family peptidase [Allochromatium humboldtianum]
MNWKFWNKRCDSLPDPSQADWDRALINRVVIEYLDDQRKRRRWSVLFKLSILIYVIVTFAVTAQFLAPASAPTEDHAALVEINGIIDTDSDASADRVIFALRTAFEAKHAKGVILRINSPGGSPVQAGYINDEIKRLKEKYKKDHDGKDMPVYAVAVDLCASGGYYVAVGADAIYVDKASLVGSIGVRMDGFGFQKAIEDLGIERRLLTAGANKGILDPFSPLDESQRDFIQGVLDQLHAQFIDEVKRGRGDKLKGGDELFSGLFWSGEEAVELGLADGLGNSTQIARDLLGTEKVVKYSKKRNPLDSMARRLGTMVGLGIRESVGLTGSLSPPY